MTHDWIREVLTDLELFVRANDLENDLIEAVAKAAAISKDSFDPTPENFELSDVSPYRTDIGG
jgi:hypothetical protein